MEEGCLSRKVTYNHLPADLWVSEVEVWLLFEELVQVTLASHLIIRPRGVAKHTHLQRDREGHDRVKVRQEREEFP